ncbi:MAG TPA: hypothetical protein VF432_27645 [Thermoanaerobaculia bacterium]
MTVKEVQKIDPAAVMQVVAAASASFDATLTSDERAALEKLRANEGSQGLAYSTSEREQALEDFELLAAADSLHILADQIHATIERRAQELYERCLAAFYVAEEMAKEPEHAHLIPQVEELRQAHLRSYGRPIPPKQ